MIHSIPHLQKDGIIALLNVDDVTYDAIAQCDFGNRTLMRFRNGIELEEDWTKHNLNIVAILSQNEVLSPGGIYLLETLHKTKKPDVPFFILAQLINENSSRLCMQYGVADLYKLPIQTSQLNTRLDYLINNWQSLKTSNSPAQTNLYKTPFIKRAFDVVFAGSVLLCLAPFLLIIMLLMRLESKGPIFYYSLRVGSGYRIFKFYKFRSMYVNADQRIKELMHLNQYGKDQEEEAPDDGNVLCDQCIASGTKCQQLMYADNMQWCEKNYMKAKKALSGAAFFKLKNDPRVTKIGKILRNTSIDELPQLWNVIIGDMSIVGNRPLPLYEAEKLTTDKYALRFKAPAGITGLWQVEKRGKGEMSEEERLQLDNKYALNHSFLYDIKLILKTIPALFQKESV